jgi:hypothetical protein
MGAGRYTHRRRGWPTKHSVGMRGRGAAPCSPSTCPALSERRPRDDAPEMAPETPGRYQSPRQQAERHARLVPTTPPGLARPGGSGGVLLAESQDAAAPDLRPRPAVAGPAHREQVTHPARGPGCALGGVSAGAGADRAPDGTVDADGGDRGGPGEAAGDTAKNAGTAWTMGGGDCSSFPRRHAQHSQGDRTRCDADYD